MPRPAAPAPPTGSFRGTAVPELTTRSGTVSGAYPSPHASGRIALGATPAEISAASPSTRLRTVKVSTGAPVDF